MCESVQIFLSRHDKLLLTHIFIFALLAICMTFFLLHFLLRLFEQTMPSDSVKSHKNLWKKHSHINIYTYIYIYEYKVDVPRGQNQANADALMETEWRIWWSHIVDIKDNGMLELDVKRKRLKNAVDVDFMPNRTNFIVSAWSSKVQESCVSSMTALAYCTHRTVEKLLAMECQTMKTLVPERSLQIYKRSVYLLSVEVFLWVCYSGSKMPW